MVGGDEKGVFYFLAALALTLVVGGLLGVAVVEGLRYAGMMA
jgi:hypothetical protein